jgi:hypothetical protein
MESSEICCESAAAAGTPLVVVSNMVSGDEVPLLAALLVAPQMLVLMQAVNGTTQSSVIVLGTWEKERAAVRDTLLSQPLLATSGV